MGKKLSIEERLRRLHNNPKLRGKVFSYIGSDKYKYYFTYTCDNCSTDKYVKGAGAASIFKGEYRVLMEGYFSCRCNTVNHTKETLSLDLKDLCDSKGFIFKGYVREPSDLWRTPLKINCKQHPENIIAKYSPNELLHSGELLCSECDHERHYMVKDRMLKEELPNKTYMYFSSRGNVVEVLCETCSFDKYVKKGLCSGVFKTDSSSLLKGNGVSCRCSKVPAWTLAQRKYQIECMMKDEGKGYTFVEWLTEDNGVNGTYFSYKCPVHGLQKGDINNFVNNKRRCIGCRNEKMRWRHYSDRYAEKDYLYNAFTSSNETFSKIGRTFGVVRREKDYTKTSYNFNFEVIYSSTHYKIYHLEQALHRHFKELHYTPMKPFGGSITECFSVTPEQVKEALELLEHTIPELPPEHHNQN